MATEQEELLLKLQSDVADGLRGIAEVIKQLEQLNQTSASVAERMRAVNETTARGEHNFSKLSRAIIVVNQAWQLGLGIYAQVHSWYEKLILSTVHQADALNNLSKRTGLATEQLSSYSLALRETNTNVHELASFIEIFERKLQTTGGRGVFARQLAAITERAGLGRLTAKDILGDPDKIVERIATIVQQALPQERSALMRLLGGRGSASLATFFAQGPEEILRKQGISRETGEVFGQKQIDESVRAANALARLQSSVNGLRNAVAFQLLPVFTQALDKFTQWLDKNQEAISKNVSAWIETAASALQRAAPAAQSLASALGTIATTTLDDNTALGKIIKLAFENPALAAIIFGGITRNPTMIGLGAIGLAADPDEYIRAGTALGEAGLNLFSGDPNARQRAQAQLRYMEQANREAAQSLYGERGTQQPPFSEADMAPLRQRLQMGRGFRGSTRPAPYGGAGRPKPGDPFSMFMGFGAGAAQVPWTESFKIDQSKKSFADLLNTGAFGEQDQAAQIAVERAAAHEQALIEIARAGLQTRLQLQQMTDVEFTREQQKLDEREIANEIKHQNDLLAVAKQKGDPSGILQAQAAVAAAEDQGALKREQRAGELQVKLDAQAESARQFAQQMQNLGVQADHSLTPMQRALIQIKQQWDDALEAVKEYPDRVDQVNAAYKRLSEQAQLTNINVGEAFATSITKAFEGIALGTRKLEDFGEGIRDALVGQFADAFGDMLKEKVKFDFSFKKNFLEDLPGVVSKGAGKVGSIWSNLWDLLSGGPGHGPPVSVTETAASGPNVTSLFNQPGVSGAIQGPPTAATAAAIEATPGLSSTVAGPPTADVAAGIQAGTPTAATSGIGSLGVYGAIIALAFQVAQGIAEGVKAAHKRSFQPGVTSGELLGTAFSRDPVGKLWSGIFGEETGGRIHAALLSGGLTEILHAAGVDLFKPKSRGTQAKYALNKWFNETLLPEQQEFSGSKGKGIQAKFLEAPIDQMTLDALAAAGWDWRKAGFEGLGQTVEAVSRPIGAKGASMDAGTAAGLITADAFFPGGATMMELIFGGSSAKQQLREQRMLALLQAGRAARPDVAALGTSEALGLFTVGTRADKQGVLMAQAFTNNLLLLGVSAEEGRRQLRELAEVAGVDLPKGIEIANKMFLEQHLSQEQLTTTVGGLVKLFKEDLPAGVDASALAMLNFTEKAGIDVAKFNRQMETAIQVAQGFEFQGAVSGAFATGSARTFKNLLGESYATSVAGAISQNIVESDAFKAIFAGVTTPIVEAAELYRSGDFTSANEKMAAAGNAWAAALEQGEAFVDSLIKASPELLRVIRESAAMGMAVEGMSQGISSALSPLIFDDPSAEAARRSRKQSLEEAIAQAHLFGDIIGEAELQMQLATEKQAEMFAGEAGVGARFMAALRDKIKEQILQAVVEGLLESSVLQNVLQPFLVQVGEAARGMAEHPERASEFAATIGQAWQNLAPAIQIMKDAIELLAPVIHEIGAGSTLGFGAGGPVLAAPGEPVMATVHGGEFVMTPEMLGQAASMMAQITNMWTTVGRGGGGAGIGQIIVNVGQVYGRDALELRYEMTRVMETVLDELQLNGAIAHPR